MLRSITLRWFIQIVITLLNIGGLLIFLRGFFPAKTVLPGYNEFTTTAPSPFLHNGKPQFDKVIVMVVDAMRSDFCFSETHSHFEFLHSLINQGHAIPFTAYSNPPTVTLPRLKGITTGGTPSFLDAILNVHEDDTSQGLNQDSWIYQFKKMKKKINFFGDDTWLKLFPDSFDEYEGTNSFFVSDFTEVDQNVTRHLDAQLGDGKEWDGLILHYLGLDHIGHKGGPESVYMKPKHQEMDEVLTRLYEYVELRKQKENEDILIVLMGDHGMNEIGNHGGSSTGETSSAMVLISPKVNQEKREAPLPNNDEYSYYHKISQIDLVPTLSTLLNFPIPKNSLGVISKEVLDLWPQEDRIRVLIENCKQIMQLYEAKNVQDESEIWNQWVSLQKADHPIEDYFEFLKEIQSDMASSATNYQYGDIFTGVGLLFVATISIIVFFNTYFMGNSSTSVPLVLFFQLFVVIYSFHFHGSSLIEEEHQIWYFFTSITLLYLGVFHFRAFSSVSNFAYFVLIFIGVRILKSWNNSGQKYSTNYNIGFYFSHTNEALLWFLILVTYVAVTMTTYIQGGFLPTFSLIPTKGGVPALADAGVLISLVSMFIASSISFSFKIMQYYIDGNVLPKMIRWMFLYILDSYGISIAKDAVNDNELKFRLQEVSVSMSNLAMYILLAVSVARFAVGKFRGVKYRSITDFTNLMTIYLIHHTRHENIPMFLVLIVIRFSLAKLIKRMNKQGLNIDHTILILSLVTICLQNLTFFSMGNTNSLATVDLSNAYNGVKAYSIFPVGLLTFISNFSGPVFWSLSSLQLLFEVSNTAFEGPSLEDLTFLPGLRKSVFVIKSTTTLFFYCVSATNLIASCINLRFHLFIWSVFSPKLLYFGCWSVFVNFLIDLVLAAIVLFIL
ncbi:LAS21 [[Candida] subhashii]|uniref:GPI ethanolamine phosphate transferase 2 n=1 Tax=[Candida] subhashii TaxID=561895 RepID=A0A8J5Q219_9ASCO|nr:LAS21 [[Candida] subhashii]KAG7660734.1 LAS21 [[Candida] subhashii]